MPDEDGLVGVSPVPTEPAEGWPGTELGVGPVRWLSDQADTKALKLIVPRRCAPPVGRSAPGGVERGAGTRGANRAKLAAAAIVERAAARRPDWQSRTPDPV